MLCLMVDGKAADPATTLKIVEAFADWCAYNNLVPELQRLSVRHPALATLRATALGTASACVTQSSLGGRAVARCAPADSAGAGSTAHRWSRNISVLDLKILK